MLHSVISNHTATREEILTRIKDIIKCGNKVTRIQSGVSSVVSIYLGHNLYHITYIGSTIVGFELENVYAFVLNIESEESL